MAPQPHLRERPAEPVPVLRDFAFIGDGERGALIGPDGEIVWMCAPRWHDDAVFSTLIGGSGRYFVTPLGRYTSGGEYEDGTLIWHSRWVAGQAIIESCEAMALPSGPSCAVVLRQIRAVRDNAVARALLDVRGGFGKRSMRDVRRHDDGRWTARTGKLRLRWTGAADAVLDDHGRLTLLIEVAQGGSHDLVLEISDQPLPPPADPAHLWVSTRAGLDPPGTRASDRSRPPRCSAGYRDTPRIDQLRRWHGRRRHHGPARASRPSTAATTTATPGSATSATRVSPRPAAGVDDLLDAGVGFVQERVLTDGPRLRPAYRVDGGPVPDEHQLKLPGYPGGTDIVGNWVNDQFQLDALGEVLRLLTAAARADRLDTDGWRAIEITT